MFYPRYPLVWITKYRYKGMNHESKKRVREWVAQVAQELRVEILNGVVSSDPVPIFANIPPHFPVSEFVKNAKGRSSRKIQQEFPQRKKTYWGRHFWARGYFRATRGNGTDDILHESIHRHTDAQEPQEGSRIRLESL